MIVLVGSAGAPAAALFEVATVVTLAFPFDATRFEEDAALGGDGDRKSREDPDLQRVSSDAYVTRGVCKGDPEEDEAML